VGRFPILLVTRLRSQLCFLSTPKLITRKTPIPVNVFAHENSLSWYWFQFISIVGNSPLLSPKDYHLDDGRDQYLQQRVEYWARPCTKRLFDVGHCLSTRMESTNCAWSSVLTSTANDHSHQVIPVVIVTTGALPLIALDCAVLN